MTVYHVLLYCFDCDTMNCEMEVSMSDKMVSLMSVDEARERRDMLDNTPMNELPGASRIGPIAALRAYKIYRTFLTNRINAG